VDEERALHDLVDHIPAGLVIAEAPTGRIVLFNGEAGRILGHPLIEASERDDYVQYGALHEDGRPYEPHDHPLARALEGETLHHEPVRYRRGDGAIVQLSVNAAPVRNADGVIVAAITSFSDVTELRSAEEHLRKGLEQLVEVRTHELTQRSLELDRVNRELRALSEGLEELVRQRTAELEASQARLAHQALHDHLTGLPNRVLLEERLERAMAAAKRHRRGLAILFIDLDGFKAVNDTHGHASGDAVLRQVASRLAGSLRDSDTLARLGGDEFMALVTDLQRPDDAAEVAAGLLAAVRGEFVVGDTRMPLAASIGISLYPDDGTDAVTLQRRADVAMYLAKDAGGDCARFATTTMASETDGS
jgi:diguanylate cyclase (GGDEF)-like protein/PAS domain S-box-containing protein